VAYSRRSSRSPRSRFTVGLLILTSVTILVLDLPGTGPLDPVRNLFASAFRPVRAAADVIFEPISNGWKGAFGYDELSDENAELQRQLAELQGDQAELEQLRAENAELKKLNGIATGEEPSKAAEVISGPLSSFEQSVEIDVGSGDGIAEGMAVVTGGGVLGRVADVKRSTSTVELITEPTMSVGVRLRNGDIGTVTGQGQGKDLRLEGVDDETNVRKGDLVYTSGIDRSAFPKDVVVGRVSRTADGVDGIGRDVDVTPSVDFTSRFVRVILREPPS
jgi:rod shape-determining protein MreC